MDNINVPLILIAVVVFSATLAYTTYGTDCGGSLLNDRTVQLVSALLAGYLLYRVTSQINAPMSQNS